MVALRNTFIIFGLSGLWHGANWTFVAWGLYHALLFVPLMLMGQNRRNTDTVAEGRMLPSFKEFGQIFLTFILVVIGWVIFRAESIGDAWGYVCGMFDSSTLYLPMPEDLFSQSSPITYIPMVALFAIEWLQRSKAHPLMLPTGGLFDYRAIRWIAYYILLAFVLFNASSVQTFIYFQF